MSVVSSLVDYYHWDSVTTCNGGQVCHYLSGSRREQRSSINTYRTEVINRTIYIDGSERPKHSPETAIFTSEKSSKCNGRHHAFGSVSSSETRSTTSVKYCLDGSFGHSIFRWTNLDVKWSIDSLPCKVTVLIIAVFL